MKTTILITGATAVGKTGIALDVAKYLPKAEILSVEMKCGNEIFCVTTCYRVGTLHNTNFVEVEKHLDVLLQELRSTKNIYLYR